MAESLGHLHIGAGSFGLGFVTHLTRQSGFRVVVTNRRSDNPEKIKRNEALLRQKQYTIRFLGETVRSEQVGIVDFCYLDESRDRLRTFIADPATVLMTTSLKLGVEACVPIVSDLIAARVRSAPGPMLYVMACENRVDSRRLGEMVTERFDQESIRDYRRQVAFIPSVVDRICTEPKYMDEVGHVVLDAEPYAKWEIERTEASGELETALARLATIGVAEFVEDIEPYKLRKRWFVNGPHLLVGVLAHAVGEIDVARFLRTGANIELLKGIQNELIGPILLATDRFTARELIAFGEKLARRFCEFPDRTERLVGRLRKATLEEFFADVWSRVGEPLELTLANEAADGDTKATVRAMLTAIHMVHERKYVAIRRG